MKEYKLGKRSRKELVGVHPDIVKIVKRAIKITKQDFMVFDGLRTKREQRKLVARGVSKTNNSFHLYGLAVDLIPVVRGKPTWTEKYFPEIHKAVKQAMKELGLNTLDSGFDLWGWDMPHWQLKKIKGKNARIVYKARKNKGF